MRALTAGERAVARRLFGTSLDADRVRVHARGYLPWLRRVAMAPAGELYFPPALYRADFSRAGPRSQCLFVHELTHVWQYQQGVPVRLAGVCLCLQGAYWLRDAYRYPAGDARPFRAYNFEQQAELVARYWGARLGLAECAAEEAWLGEVLAGFFADPAAPALLPARWWRL
ncbi:type IV secretion protein Rhs [Crenobacter caeni]|uniref:Type IV secretion protein Rhs n=1 Tax=Crenobacter caeni TaxID=2705474 RepID=A0A6B2KPH2_9NEIS|nr:type IV secretion protein Rhs [Crenobacter caeni]NDV12011.1 type IV secretion protein Rhs [Crenobacter caeni]